MARIRSIKPEFPQSESMGRISRDSRLTFIQCWTLADDEGRLRGNSRMLASLLFPYDDDAPALIDGWLAELEREACIVRYQADGQSYIQIHNWLNHQKIDHASKSKIPAFDESSRIVAKPREPSSEDQGLDQGKDQGSRKEPSAQKAARFDPRAELISRGVTETVADDFLKVRKTKRAELTLTAIDGVALEAGKAGLTLDSALRESCARGWQGFKAEWIENGKGAANGKNGSSRADRLNNVVAELTGANRHPAPAIDGVAARVD